MIPVPVLVTVIAIQFVIIGLLLRWKIKSFPMYRCPYCGGEVEITIDWTQNYDKLQQLGRCKKCKKGIARDAGGPWVEAAFDDERQRLADQQRVP